MTCKHCTGAHRSNHCPMRTRAHRHCRMCGSLDHGGNNCPLRVARMAAAAGDLCAEMIELHEQAAREVNGLTTRGRKP